MTKFVAILLLTISWTSLASAEYRVALVFGGDEVKPVVSSLEGYGFRCTVSELLSDKEYRRKVESWTSTTPTNSTAIVYHSGKVAPANYDDKPTLTLIGSNDRSAGTVTQFFEQMTTRGGSRANILICSDTTAPELKGDVPEGCQFLHADLGANAGKLKGADLAAILASIGKGIRSNLPDGFQISGKGSVAISPPDKFIPGKKAGDEWVNARGMVFCWCPPGKYIAGSPEGTPGRYEDEEQREVVIKDGFWIGKYEVARGQALRNLSRNSIGTHKNHPIERLHWDDGRPMASRTLTEEERKAGRIPSSWQYDVPTEDQWEYAARAGTNTRYFFGDDMSELPKYANFGDKSFYDSGDIFSNAAHRTLDDGVVRLAKVGSFLPNPWGLHDIYGNVSEWCRDNGGARGGSWVSRPENCRSAYRDYYSSRNEQIYLGYRFVIQPNQPDPKKK